MFSILVRKITLIEKTIVSMIIYTIPTLIEFTLYK